MESKTDKRNSIVTKQNNQVNEKDHSTETKVKRKSKSSKRRLKAMMSNASFHFSDTDSEGELTAIISDIGRIDLTKASKNERCGPVISVTNTDNAQLEFKMNDDIDYLIANSETRSRRNSFLENLTDVEEIYTNDTEEEDRKSKSKKRNLKVVSNIDDGETDLEDMEDDCETHPTIYVLPRSDILNNCYEETIITKEGDGPFSKEIRNQLSQQGISIDKNTENIPDMLNTDSEDIETSGDDEKVIETFRSPMVMYEDLNVSASSQVIMTNKIENSLRIPDTVDDAISDCYTDVEDIA